MNRGCGKLAELSNGSNRGHTESVESMIHGFVACLQEDNSELPQSHDLHRLWINTPTLTCFTRQPSFNFTAAGWLARETRHLHRHVKMHMPTSYTTWHNILNLESRACDEANSQHQEVVTHLEVVILPTNLSFPLILA